MSKREYSVNTVEAKNRLNELIDRACETGQPVVVCRWGEPVAVVVDYKRFKKKETPVKKKEDRVFLDELKAFHRTLKGKYPGATSDSVEILRQARHERSSR